LILCPCFNPEVKVYDKPKNQQEINCSDNYSKPEKKFLPFPCFAAYFIAHLFSLFRPNAKLANQTSNPVPANLNNSN